MQEEQEPAAMKAEEPTVSVLRVSSVGIGLTVLFALLLPDWVIRYKGDVDTGEFLPLIPVFCALVLLAVRPVLPGRRWSNPEILAVFCILLIGTSGMGLVGRFIAILPSAYYYASPENDYVNHFLREVPGFLGLGSAVRGESSWDALVWFYRGMPNGQTTPWQLWIGPLSWWGILIGLVLFAQFCLGSLFRKQWIEHEKLMFPHAAVLTGLLEPSEDMDRPVYQVRLFWFGLGTSVILFGIDGLNAYFPEIPKIGFANISLSEILNDNPWRALGSHRKLSIQPFIVSISYLVTTEISFSIWIFAILDLVSRVMAWSLTMTTPTRDAWIGESTINSGATHFGAIIVFIGVFVWSGRRHFRDVLLHATGRKSGEDRDELLPHVLAFWGFWFSVAGVLFWCWLVDVPLWFSALVFCVYSVMVLFASRLIAETGMVKMQLWLFRSHKWSTNLVGYKSGGTVMGADGSQKQALLKPLGVFSMVYTPMLVGHHLLVNTMTGFRATETIRSGRRAIAFASLAALIVGSVIFAWKFLDMTYQVGALNVDQEWYREVYHIYNNTLIRDILLRERSHTPDWTLISFIGWGTAVMGFLVYMRQNFYWWPIHPIGYVTTGLNGGIWFSVFLGWMIKTRVLKYAGGEGYKKLIPFFLGLFVGEYAAAGFWAVVGAFAGAMRFDVLRLETLSF